MTEAEFKKKPRDEGFIEPQIYKAKPGPISAMHCHDKSIMSLVLKGEFTMITEKGEKDYKAVDCYLIYRAVGCLLWVGSRRLICDSECLFSPKETLKFASCGSENGQKRTLDI